MSATPPDDPPPFDEGEYAVLKVPDAWHVLSLVFFIASLGARFVVRFLPPVRGIWFRPVLTAYLVPFLAGLGLMFGLVALRKPETRGVARVAVFLNLIVLALSALALAAFFWILPD